MWENNVGLLDGFVHNSSLNRYIYSPIEAECNACFYSPQRHREHRDPNLNKRDEDFVPVQVSLKDIWEALMKK